MLKAEILERLKGISDSIECKKKMDLKESVLCIDTRSYDRDIRALTAAIYAVTNSDIDEREKITVEVMATKAAEGDAYYYELETGERLVIREGRIEGIYNPEEKPNEWKTAFIELCDCTSCSNCPVKTYCARRKGEDKECYEIMKDFLIKNKDE